MREYRKTIIDEGSDRTYVELGPIPGLPDWHIQSKPSSYGFPTPQAAERFASRHREFHPGREVTVRPVNHLTCTERKK